MAKIVLIIEDGVLPVCRSLEWPSVPRKGDEVSLVASFNSNARAWTVKSVIWQQDGTAHVFLAGGIDGNRSDLLIEQHQWNRYVP